MKIRTLVFTLALGLPAVTLADVDKNDPMNDKSNDKMEKTGKLSESDAKVVENLHMVNQMEIDMGRVAASRATAPVKTYANMLIMDHTKADKELTAFAKKQGMSPIPSDMSESEHKDMMESQAKLKSLKGPELDRAYLNMMVEGHDKLLAKIDSEMGSIDNKDLQKMVTDFKPVVQKHADDARKLQANAPVSRTP